MPTYFNTFENQGQKVTSPDIIYVTQNGFISSILNISGLSTVYVQGHVNVLQNYAGGDPGFQRNDDIIVSGGGTVQLLLLGGNGNNISNAGVIGSGGTSILFTSFGGFNPTGVNTVTNSGLIVSNGGSGGDAVIRTEAGENISTTVIVNSGTISSGSGKAIELGSAGDRVLNSGTIRGDVRLGEGLNSLDNNAGSIFGRIVAGNGGNTLLNAATVSVASGNAIVFGSGADRVLNTGTINGNLNLGDGANFLDSTSGHIFGTITTGSGSDVIRTGDIDAIVSSGAGIDIIRGGAGDDSLYGGANGDVLYGQGGRDLLEAGDTDSSNRLYGGEGDDTYVIRSASDLVDERLFGGSGIDSVQVRGNFSFSLSNRANARGDVEDIILLGITQLENINGTGNALGNAISGNSGANVLRGLEGDDELFGQAGNDKLLGGAGNDSIAGGAGADRIDGGDGVDWANYDRSAARVIVYLDGLGANAGDAAGDTFKDIENLRGTDLNVVNGDQLRGDDAANTILGLRGNDSLYGQDGRDVLYGGLGSDFLSGGADVDLFAYESAAEGGDFILDFSSDVDDFAFATGAFSGLTADTFIAANFVERGDNAAQDGNDFFIFRTTDGTLWFDADGSAAVSAAVLIADIQAGETIQFSDITFL